jgi:hypothetical protein
MAQFQAFAEGVEVNGETVLSVLNGMLGSREIARGILAKHGIADPQPGQWYPQQAWLDAFKDIADQVGVTALLEIGKTIPESAQWPPGTDSIEKAMALIDVAYHMNHRGGEIGHYQFKDRGDRAGAMICHNPYPCNFDWGLVGAVANKFKPKDVAVVSVKHDDSQPCREKGGDACTFLIRW